MKRQDNLDKATQDWIKIIESLCDLLDAGKSFEELTVAYDIGAAGGAIPEELGEIVHEALELMRELQEQGADRNEVINLLTGGRKGFV
jgi:hypothetical protein